MTDIKRINVAASAEMLAAIRLVMDREGIGLTEAVRRLIRYGDFIYRAVKVDDAQIIFRNGSTERELVIL